MFKLLKKKNTHTHIIRIQRKLKHCSLNSIKKSKVGIFINMFKYNICMCL